MARHARQLRSQGAESPFVHPAASQGAESPFVHPAASPGASSLFPTGYEDGLRALGYQLDMRGVRSLVIREQEATLNMEYMLLDAAPSGSATVQRLALSATDMEAVLASAIDRCGAGRGMAWSHPPRTVRPVVVDRSRREEEVPCGAIRGSRGRPCCGRQAP